MTPITDQELFDFVTRIRNLQHEATQLRVAVDFAVQIVQGLDIPPAKKKTTLLMINSLLRKASSGPPTQ